MRVSSLSGDHVANSSSELLSLLRERHDARFGTFWISHDTFPALLIGINADQAWLNYIPADEDAGFLSQGHLSATSGEIEFLNDDRQPDLRPASCVVPTTVAEKAALEFFESEGLPASVQWLRL